MATLLAQTQWHGNPRPVEAYASGVSDGLVASPYYLDGRDVALINHVVTPVPLADLVPGAAILVPGPAAEVSAEVTGLIATGSSLTYGFTGPNIGTFGGSAAQNGPTATGEQFAVIVANTLNAKHGDVITATADGTTVTIVANDASNVTITTWTLA